MRLIKPITAISALTLFSFLHIAAQQSSNTLLNNYLQSSIHRQSIVSGKEYARPGFYINKGIPYYKSDSLAYGRVMFDHVVHDSVRLLYDQIADELITTDVSGQNLIMLVKAKVQYFTIFSDSFVHIVASNSIIVPGYYQVLYNGNTQLLKKESKSIVDEIRMDEALKKNIVSKNRMYLKLNGEYYSIGSMGAVVNILGNKKAELNSFIKKNRKRYKKIDLGEALKEVLTYYDQLTN